MSIRRCTYRIAARAGCLATLIFAEALRAQGRPEFEVHAWGSLSRFSIPDANGDRTTGVGLRWLEFAVWPTSTLRLFAIYENSLSLENLALLRTDRTVPALRAGALLDWNSRQFTTVLEGGHRTLPGRIGQTLLRAEQIIHTAGGTAFKAGGLVGQRSDEQTEWVAHVGVNQPLSSSFRVEPVVFYGRSGLPGEWQWRGLLGMEYRTVDDLMIGGGVAAGHNESMEEDLTGRVFDAHFRASTRLGGLNRGHIMVRHERLAGARPLTVFAVGISLVTSRKP